MDLIPVTITYSIGIDRAMMGLLAVERRFFSYHNLLATKLEEIAGVSSADYDLDYSTIFVTINVPSDSPVLHRMISRVIIQHLVACRHLAKKMT